MAYVKVRIIDKGGLKWLKTAPKKVAKYGDQGMKALAKKGTELIKDAARQSGITEWRNKMINPIRYSKIRKGEYKIIIPETIARLDYMPGHYVALKPGRLITEWAKDRFGTRKTSGLSRVRYGKRGGIKGAVYVIQRPFVNRGFKRIGNYADRIANRIANKIVRG